jgi:translation elongation factor P/translation initiation factor 5A
MRYLKRFNEAIEPDEIKDFCEMYLAYLLDDGYALAFWENGRVTQIDFVKPKTDVEHIAVDWMDWDQIKDSFIPFLKVLDKQYDIKDNLIFFQIRGAAQVKMSFQDVIDDKVKEKIFSVTKGYKNHDYDHATVISSVKIVVLDHSVGQYSWQLRTNESFKDDVLEFTQDRLAYLMDDGFDITTRDTQNGYWREYNIDCTRISIVKRSGFTWEEITDRFSPYIYMLNKEYSILEIVFHQSGGRQYQYDTRKDIEELVSGEADQYLTNKIYWMITIIVKK